MYLRSASKQQQQSAKNNQLILSSHSFAEPKAPLKRKEADTRICIRAGVLAGGAEGVATPRPCQSEPAFVRASGWIGVLRLCRTNNVSLANVGTEKKKGAVWTNRNRKVGRSRRVQESALKA